MNGVHQSKRPCPVCQSKEGFALAHLRYALFDDMNLPDSKTLVQCSTCGMLYDDVLFTGDQLAEYYYKNEHYAASVIGGSGSATEDNKARYDRIIDLLEPDSKGVILDLGCGQGGFISRCIERGLKASGIEFSPKSREAAGKAGIKAYESVSAFAADNPGSKLHAVIFSHVLEHMMYPLNMFRANYGYFKDALAYIEVPDACSYLSPGTVRWHEMYFEHLSHFRKNNIEELAGRACIKILKDGETPFSELCKDTRCRFIVGKFTLKQEQTATSVFSGCPYDPALKLPPLSFKHIPQDDRPFALWGVSQYAMLLMGSCPGLACRIRRLFDSSPAKIGRKIKGIIIESADNLPALTDEYILLIPKSNYLFQMRSQLKTIDFKGQIIEV